MFVNKETRWTFCDRRRYRRCTGVGKYSVCGGQARTGRAQAYDNDIVQYHDLQVTGTAIGTSTSRAAWLRLDRRRVPARCIPPV